MTASPPEGLLRTTVPAREMWVATPAVIRTGRRITVRARGIWWDFYIPCGPNGYPAGLAYRLGRRPRLDDEGRYFRLMGRIGDLDGPPATDDATQTFAIGPTRTIVAPRDGRLYLFANDAADRYGNNWGRLRVEITLD